MVAYDSTIFALQLLFLLIVKHFIVDFPLQVWPYQYANKDKYGHPGGLLHAFLHFIGTFAVVSGLFLFVTRGAPHTLVTYGAIAYIAAYVAAFDSVVHYHIDWAKMKVQKQKGWTANTHPEFWILLGVDQLLHSLTYLLIVYWIVL